MDIVLFMLYYLSKEALLDQVKTAFQTDLETYAPFIDGCGTDPIEDINAYVDDANYNSNIVDLIIPVLAKILGIHWNNCFTDWQLQVKLSD